MKRTLYLAFLAVALGSLATAQDGRGRNKQDQRSTPPRQEQRRDTPPPQREQRRETPPPPQREQRRETPPPPQREQKRETPPPPRRDDTDRDRSPSRNTPPPPRRDDDGRGRTPDRTPQRTDDQRRGSPRQDDQRQGRNTPPPPTRDRTSGSVRNLPDVRRGGDQPGNTRGVNTTHNMPVDRTARRRPLTPPPTVVNSKVTNRAWREDRTVRTVPYRSGYHHYNDSWVDSNFCYPYYVYDFSDRCAPSPWYWYPHLPAYVAVSRCRPTVSVVFNFGWGLRYDYRPYYYTTFEPSRLDVAADRIEDAFRRRDFDRFSYLVDRGDWVQIQVENADTYDLRGDDFAEMLRDLIEETHTLSYKITDVRSWRDGASITARHTYVDSWGRREVVEHSYGFRMTRDGYRVVSFRTDHF